MLETLPFVELMGTFADHVGTDGHALAAALSCPGFRRFDQLSSGSEAAVGFRNDEAVDFGAGSDIDQMSDADMNPANDACFWRIGDKQGVLRGREEAFHSFENVRGGGRITKLRAQLRNASGVCTAGAANCNFVAHEIVRGRSAGLAPQTGLHRGAFQLAERIRGNPTSRARFLFPNSLRCVNRQLI
jgi:hypothetical protein